MAEPNRRKIAALAASRLPSCVGIDLAGVEHRETGVAVLRDGRLELLTSAGTDEEILTLAALAGPGGVVAVNAPLTRPAGRCCLDDDCPCRTDPGTRSRQWERELARMRIPTLATALLKVLARRGERIAQALRSLGYEPLEVYPFATLRVLGLPAAGKRTARGRRDIRRALRPLVPGLRHPRASEHQLDAVVCALTAQLWREGRTRVVGDPAEGVVVIPESP
jgi:predicted nuclease with RNAse H fold